MEPGNDLDVSLLALGGLFFLGLIADTIGRRTFLPRVTLLILCGVVSGLAGLDLVPSVISAQYEFLAIVALTMVAFLLGGTFSVARHRSHAREMLMISIVVVVATATIVGGGLALAGVELPLGLLPPNPAASVNQISADLWRFFEPSRSLICVKDAWRGSRLAFNDLGALNVRGDGRYRSHSCDCAPATVTSK